MFAVLVCGASSLTSALTVSPSLRATLPKPSGLAVPFIWWSYSAAISLLWISPDTWSNDRTVLACANTLLNKTALKNIF